MATSDVQAYTQALYESLMGKALAQLRAAAPEVAQISPKAKDIQKQIQAALPPDALPEVKNFLLLLARDGALDQLPAIVDTLENYSKGGPALPLSAEVTSAVPLNDEQQKHIADELRRHAQQQDLDVTFSVDETLIGGLIIRVGDQVLDNSLRSRLGAIQRNMIIS